jgi:hypothetical protein
MCEQTTMQLAPVRGAPQWLCGLLSEFFNACAAHPGERKNDKNHFYVDCAAAASLAPSRMCCLFPCRGSTIGMHVERSPAPNKPISNSSLYLFD